MKRDEQQAEAVILFSHASSVYNIHVTESSAILPNTPALV